MASIVYSCLIDEGPKFQHQARILIETLNRNAGVAYGRIYAHLTASGPEISGWLSERGVHVVPVSRFGDGKFCNKIAQVDSAGRFEGEYVFFLDCDLAFVSSIEGAVDGREGGVLGKPVDFPNPPIELLEEALTLGGLPHSGRTSANLVPEPTIRGNFNGGVLGLPVRELRGFGRTWKERALQLLKDEAVMGLLGRYGMHVDQISFALALHDSGLPSWSLALGNNCPTHVWLPRSGGEVTELPRALHFHDNFNQEGLLGYCGAALLDLAIDRVNASVSDLANHPDYLRYESSGPRRLPLHSKCLGVHSVTDVNKNAFHGLLRSAGLESARSIMEYRCGSGAHLDGLRLSDYSGVDPRRGLVALGQRRGGDLRFTAGDLEAAAERAADVVVCLDILGAMESGESLRELVSRLGRCARQRVIFAGPNHPWKVLDARAGVEQCLRRAMLDSNLFRHVIWLGRHAGMDLLVGERPDLAGGGRDAADDLRASQLAQALATSRWPELLAECVLVARATVGWRGAGLPQMFELPWILNQLGPELRGWRVGDLQPARSPLPLCLANRGAAVVTVESTCPGVVAGSSQYFDFGAVHGDIETRRASVTTGSFRPESFDAWLSVGSLGYASAQERSAVVEVLAGALKQRGRLLLTLHLHKRSRDLWVGLGAEQAQQRGTMQSVLEELEGRGLTISYTEFVPLPFSEEVDLGFVEAVRGRRAVPCASGIVVRARPGTARSAWNRFKRSRVAAPLRRLHRFLRATARSALSQWE